MMFGVSSVKVTFCIKVFFFGFVFFGFDFVKTVSSNSSRSVQDGATKIFSFFSGRGVATRFFTLFAFSVFLERFRDLVSFSFFDSLFLFRSFFDIFIFFAGASLSIVFLFLVLVVIF